MNENCDDKTSAMWMDMADQAYPFLSNINLTCPISWG